VCLPLEKEQPEQERAGHDDQDRRNPIDQLQHLITLYPRSATSRASAPPDQSEAQAKDAEDDSDDPHCSVRHDGLTILRLIAS
jgi:hypothetical protein